MVSKRISELPAAGDLDGSEQIPLTQAGETRRIPSDTYQPTHMLDVSRADFGAVLDGTADDSAAVQAAIDSLNGERGLVYIGGHALCEADVDQKRAILVGDGPPDNSGGGGSVLEFTSNFGLSSSVEQNYGTALVGLEVRGSNGGTPTASGQVLVDFTGQNYPRLTNCRVRRGEVAVRLAAGTNVECHYGRFVGVDIDECVQGWDADDNTHDIFGGRAQGCTDGADIASGVSSVNFYGTSFENNSNSGISSTGDNIFLAGVYFENTGATNLNVRSGAGHHVHTGCHWSSGTAIADANSPTVVSGIAPSGGDIDSRIAENLYVGDDLRVGNGDDAADRVLGLAAPAGQNRDLRVFSGDPDDGSALRWIVRFNNAAESGGNAGSNLQIFARDDTGGAIGTWVIITRSSGKVRFAGSELEIDGDINHDGSNAGFFGAAPTSQQTAPASLTDNSGGTTDDTVEAVSGSGADAAINNNFAELTEELNQVRQALVNLGLWA